MAKGKKEIKLKKPDDRYREVTVTYDESFALFQMINGISLTGITDDNDRQAIIDSLRATKKVAKDIEESVKDIREKLETDEYKELKKRIDEEDKTLTDDDKVYFENLTKAKNEDEESTLKAFLQNSTTIRFTLMSKKAFKVITGNSSNKTIQPGGFLLIEDYMVKADSE